MQSYMITPTAMTPRVLSLVSTAVITGWWRKSMTKPEIWLSCPPKWVSRFLWKCTVITLHHRHHACAKFDHNRLGGSLANICEMLRASIPVSYFFSGGFSPTLQKMLLEQNSPFLGSEVVVARYDFWGFQHQMLHFLITTEYLLIRMTYVCNPCASLQ